MRPFLTARLGPKPQRADLSAQLKPSENLDYAVKEIGKVSLLY